MTGRERTAVRKALIGLMRAHAALTDLLVDVVRGDASLEGMDFDRRYSEVRAAFGAHEEQMATLLEASARTSDA